MANTLQMEQELTCHILTVFHRLFVRQANYANYHFHQSEEPQIPLAFQQKPYLSPLTVHQQNLVVDKLHFLAKLLDPLYLLPPWHLSFDQKKLVLSFHPIFYSEMRLVARVKSFYQ